MKGKTMPTMYCNVNKLKYVYNCQEYKINKSLTLKSCFCTNKRLHVLD